MQNFNVCVFYLILFLNLAMWVKLAYIETIVYI